MLESEVDLIQSCESASTSSPPHFTSTNRPGLSHRPLLHTNHSGAKPALTGSYLIDDELHQLIELILRDYVDVW
jgi:hypothetical protein